MNSTEYNNLIRLQFVCDQLVEQQVLNKLKRLFGNIEYTNMTLVIVPGLHELTPSRIGAVFNCTSVKCTRIIFESVVSVKNYQSFIRAVDDHTLELLVPDTEHFFRLYQILYEDIITCNCLKNKVEKSEVVMRVQNTAVVVSNRTVVAQALKQTNMIFHSDLSGFCIRGPELTAVYHGVSALFLGVVGVDCQQIMLPKVVSTADLLKTGHMRRFGRELFYVSEFKDRQNPDCSTSLNRSAYLNRVTPEIIQQLKPSDRCLTYSQCDALWSM